jgi:signal transduction histidine kinase/CheY-like chemotaxis protein
MSAPILTIALRTERDVVQARQRARELASLLGFDNQDQIRLATATSEMARNAFRYAKHGKVTFSVGSDPPQHLEVSISDSGPGIRNLEEIMEGRYRSDTGLGMGILGTKRLMDHFSITSQPSGTGVEMSKRLPRSTRLLTASSIREISQALNAHEPENPYGEIERQNQELLKTLQELRSRQDELMLLNRELEDTNRGVVALYAELDERADYLRRASELKTKFLSNVSHEFRTPLNSIISLARLLMQRMDGDLSGEQEKQVRYIESSARDLQEMVNDLLDLAKAEAGKIKIRTKEFEVHELFSALKGMLKPLLADNLSVDLVFEDTHSLPPLRTDEGKVSQILRNLISNALKFTPNGKVTVCARDMENGSVLFEVEDSGIGIAPEHQESIFREFSQVDNPLQERHRGTGLGLPLCRNLAMLLGGRVWLESEMGVGSKFFVEIPVAYKGESLPAEDAAAVPAPEFHRSPILFVESDSDQASQLESHLRHTEYQAIITAEVIQADLWIARHTPSTVVVNARADGGRSWEFLRRLREQHPALQLLVTGDPADSQRAIAEGASAFVPAPLTREILLRELRQRTAQAEPRRLLIVDDNEVSRYIVSELLDRPWLTITEAGNGREALRLIATERPDAVILDLLMPDMSGIEVLRQLRQDPPTQTLPVLIYTSKTLTDAEKTQLEESGTSVVRKEDVSSRLSARPFLDWLAKAGLSPDESLSEQNA